MKNEHATQSLRESCLVQRLQKPYKTDGVFSDLANVFAFGGGLKNGGLSDDAMKLIKHIWRFDYMGSAEFEFGAVPDALHKIAQTAEADGLVAFEVQVHTDPKARVWGEQKPGKMTGTVWGLCPPAWVDEVKARIQEWAFSEFPKKQTGQRTKEFVGLERCLRDPESIHIAHGWLELDNGFMFFTDRAMFEATAKLFGVNVDESHPVVH